MLRPICVCSSDWHLENNAWVRYPELKGDSYYALKQIVDLCLERKLPLIAAGDLFDKPLPDSKSVMVALEQMQRMASAALPVLFTQGQHEKNKDQAWLGLDYWPRHMHMKTYELSGFKVGGLDYTPPHLLAKNLKALLSQGIQILICHQVWSNFMGSIVTADGTLEDVPLENGAIITGDYHVHTTYQTYKTNNVVLSPGSMCLQSISEPSDKAVFILYEDFSHESVYLKARKLYQHIINTKQDLQNFLGTVNTGYLEPQSKVPAHIATPILSVRYNGRIKNVYQEITAALEGKKVHLFIRPQVDELEIRQVRCAEAQETIKLGLEGNLSKLCETGSATYVITQQLLASDNPEKELEQLQEEFFNK